MKLLAYRDTVIKRNEGIVQTQLASEYLSRVEKLCALANTHDFYPAMEMDGIYKDWTKSGFRSLELSDSLKVPLHVIFYFNKTNVKAKYDDLIIDIWAAFYTLRLKVLALCL